LDEFVVLGTTTNVRFLRELCDNEDVVSGATTTTTIEDRWPNGWAPQRDEALANAALACAAAAESFGMHRNSTSSGGTDRADGPVSPFATLSRRYP